MIHAKKQPDNALKYILQESLVIRSQSPGHKLTDTASSHRNIGTGQIKFKLAVDIFMENFGIDHSGTQNALMWAD